MKRRSLLTGAAVWTCLLPITLFAGSRGEPDYYPLKVGTKWEMRVTVQGKTVKMTNQIEKTEVVNGVSQAVLKVMGGPVPQTEHLSSNRQGVFRHKFNTFDVSPPICLVKYPIKPGETWTSEHQMGPDKAKLVTTVGNFQQVQVPAGQFNAIPVTLNTSAKGQNINTTYWFAPNIGIVKQTATVGPLNVTMELEKYEAGK